MSVAALDRQRALDLHLEDMKVQHRRIDSLVDDVEAAITAGRSRRQTLWVLEDLLEYAVLHLADEEQFMATHMYPGLEEHAAIHQELRSGIAEMKRGFEAGVAGLTEVRALRRTIIEHIEKWDQQYIEFVLGRTAD
jgi:hemerythrin